MYYNWELFKSTSLMHTFRLKNSSNLGQRQGKPGSPENVYSSQRKNLVPQNQSCDYDMPLPITACFSSAK